MTQRERTRRAHRRYLLVVELRRMGWTWDRIGRRMGCSGPRAFILHKLGLELVERRTAAGII